jgi:hypothetical protein
MNRRLDWSIEGTTGIEAGMVWLGTNKEQATAVLPRLRSTNRSEVSLGERQQWVIEKPVGGVIQTVPERILTIPIVF